MSKVIRAFVVSKLHKGSFCALYIIYVHFCFSCVKMILLTMMSYLVWMKIIWSKFLFSSKFVVQTLHKAIIVTLVWTSQFVEALVFYFISPEPKA